MNEEQLQRAIEFILKSQADFASQMAIIKENNKEMNKEMKKRHKEFELKDELLQTKLEHLRETVQELGVLSHNLLEVEQIHSRSLDRLEGIQPH